MSRVDIVAQAYGLDANDVQRWPGRVLEVFHRNAINRGWLVAS